MLTASTQTSALASEVNELRKKITMERTTADGTLQLLRNYNQYASIRHTERFSLKEGHIPIVVYVYNRPQYLKTVLEKLSQVVGIEETLLIISHDTLSEDMMQVVREKATFCQVKEIFHPVSPTHDSTLADLKKHWWWMQNYVWLSIPQLHKHEGYIAFVEEDHAVSQDFYRTLQTLVRMKDKIDLNDVWGIAMSPYYQKNMPKESPYEFMYQYGFMNTGYAFNRTIWEKLQEEKDRFLQFNDGWDMSLARLMQLDRFPPKQLLPKLSRVFNIGEHGLNLKAEDYVRFGLSTMPVSEIEALDPSQIVISSKIKGMHPRDLPQFEGVEIMDVSHYEELKEAEMSHAKHEMESRLEHHIELEKQAKQTSPKSESTASESKAKKKLASKGNMRGKK